jgi:hypothetical protein
MRVRPMCNRIVCSLSADLVDRSDVRIDPRGQRGLGTRDQLPAGETGVLKGLFLALILAAPRDATTMGYSFPSC